ncbi:unnamed protein product [Mytilus coruscus]|uniref:Uncharacterized protein n=1 Tax=Mytilus coruscus TaxID=42192 RepID=A0A6J8BID3_MYTCO|nr:unnamed protein product [Mytilus coruscus]
MITNASIGQHQTQPVQPEIRASRIRALRILGGAQIGLGVVCVILGIVGVILSNIEMNSHCQTYNYYSSDYGYEYRYSYYECGNANTIIIMDLIGMAFSGWQQSVIYIHTAQSGMMHNIPNTPIPTGNQQGFHQIWKPEMQGYNGQQPANMPNNQQQAGHSQGNQIPIQGYYEQPPQQNINEQQLVHTPEAAAYMNQPFSIDDNYIRS